MNSDPRSFVKTFSQGYLANYVLSNKFDIVIAFVSYYRVTSNHPVTGSTIVISFDIKGYFNFLRIL